LSEVAPIDNESLPGPRSIELVTPPIVVGIVTVSPPLPKITPKSPIWVVKKTITPGVKPLMFARASRSDPDEHVSPGRVSRVIDEKVGLTEVIPDEDRPENVLNSGRPPRA